MAVSGPFARSGNEALSGNVGALSLNPGSELNRSVIETVPYNTVSPNRDDSDSSTSGNKQAEKTVGGVGGAPPADDVNLNEGSDENLNNTEYMDEVSPEFLSHVADGEVHDNVLDEELPDGFTDVETPSGKGGNGIVWDSGLEQMYYQTPYGPGSEIVDPSTIQTLPADYHKVSANSASSKKKKIIYIAVAAAVVIVLFLLFRKKKNQKRR